jgi:hypothetical protein
MIKNLNENNTKKITIHINDPIVKKTSFMPLLSWWMYITTHKLILDNFWNIILKINKLFNIIPIIIIIASILKISELIINPSILQNLTDDDFWLKVMMPLIFLIIWIFLFVKRKKSKIFDFESWYFYDLKYKSNIYEYIYQNEKFNKNIIKLKDIHAIQIIEKSVNNNISRERYWRYITYELNIILKDTFRINIVEFNDIIDIRNISTLISEKLWVEVYDYSKYNYIFE